MGGDKAYDTRDFVADLRACQVTPHVAQNNKGRRSAIDQRTTRHPGYEVSQRKRKRVEEIFGWLKTVRLLRKTPHRGVRLVGWIFKFATAAYNLVRIRNLDEIKEELRPVARRRSGRRTKVANEPLKRSTLERKSHIIDKQNYSMKTKELLILNFSAAC